MTEYVKVNYARRRYVYIDGEKSGFTNKILRVGKRKMTFSLGEPDNYTPGSVTKTVKNTTSIKPLEIQFSLDT
ncbi:MAG: hypothetical protein COB20_07620 [SAR86 cluster bacterium]|uniref:PEGA domain-containing protein n=1 Tax=SAR86 cluster bacterium TaxID=2030880 RepID=A0A2A4X4Y0_9GAMM|nr:MAG: hypothetical protein COB20_07620 [SAR86 cluster bacterium]